MIIFLRAAESCCRIFLSVDFMIMYGRRAWVSYALDSVSLTHSSKSTGSQWECVHVRVSFTSVLTEWGLTVWLLFWSNSGINKHESYFRPSHKPPAISFPSVKKFLKRVHKFHLCQMNLIWMSIQRNCTVLVCKLIELYYYGHCYFVCYCMYLVQFRPIIALLKYQIYRQHACLYIRVVQNLKFKCKCVLS